MDTYIVVTHVLFDEDDYTNSCKFFNSFSQAKKYADHIESTYIHAVCDIYKAEQIAVRQTERRCKANEKYLPL